MEYRHEWKQEINHSDLLILRKRLWAVTRPDSHSVNGTYEIRSLYFDTANDKALREKIDGVNVREKFRIRYYNRDPSFIRLEKKSKVNGLSVKDSISITKAEAQALVDGTWTFPAGSDAPLLKEFYIKLKNQGLRPKTLVDYTREAFFFPPGHVRVTLDSDIRTGLSSTDLLNPQAVTIPAGASPIILEVKWSGFLPDIIRNIIWLPGRRTCAFSKYAACRIYG